MVGGTVESWRLLSATSAHRCRVLGWTANGAGSCDSYGWEARTQRWKARVISCAAFERATAPSAAPMASTQHPLASVAAWIDFRPRAAGGRISRLVMVLALAVCTPAGAAEPAAREVSCGKTGRPWVKFERADRDHAPHGFDAIVQHVRAELALQRIDVCFQGTGQPPIATVQLTARSTEALEVAIDVQDALTK